MYTKVPQIVSDLQLRLAPVHALCGMLEIHSRNLTRMPSSYSEIPLHEREKPSSENQRAGKSIGPGSFGFAEFVDSMFKPAQA